MFDWQFTDADKSILLDLAAAISTILHEKEEAHANSNQMVATMMVDMMQVHT